MGSDVAADACWLIPEEQRAELTDDYKESNCNCMGTSVFDPAQCDFPGIGDFYSDAINQPEPQEPAPLREQPARPEFPPEPVQPADQSDSVAMAEYFEEASKAHGDVIAKEVSNWCLGEVSRIINAGGIDIEAFREKVGPDRLAALIQSSHGAINIATAKSVLEDMFNTGRAADERDCGAMEGVGVGGLFGLVVLAVDVWAIIHIVQSTTSTIRKVLWVVLILLLPLVGFLIWLLLGPRKTQA